MAERNGTLKSPEVPERGKATAAVPIKDERAQVTDGSRKRRASNDSVDVRHPERKRRGSNESLDVRNRQKLWLIEPGLKNNNNNNNRESLANNPSN